jgi:hypothetical protein
VVRNWKADDALSAFIFFQKQYSSTFLANKKLKDQVCKPTLVGQHAWTFFNGLVTQA